VDRENFYGSDNDYEHVDADMVTAKFEYDINGNTTIRNISRYGKTDIDRVTTGVNTGTAGLTAVTADPATWTVNRSRQRVDRQDEIMVNQTSLNSNFEIGGFKNSFTSGVELMYERQKISLSSPLGSQFLRLIYIIQMKMTYCQCLTQAVLLLMAIPKPQPFTPSIHWI